MSFLMSSPDLRSDRQMSDNKKPELVEFLDGTKAWYVDGKLHQLDGPAIELFDGTKKWYVDGKLHRIDGPAIEYPNGTKEWWVDGKLHRIDGPAIEHSDGSKKWFIFGKEYFYKELYEVTSSILLMLFPDLRSQK